MEISQIIFFVSLVIIVTGGATIFFRSEPGAALPIIVFGVLLGCGCLLYIFMNAENDPSSRYISNDEKRAAKMFTQNCKQVNYIQANNTTGLGLGVSTKGSPVVGAISSSNEDSYVYSCDGGVQYTLTYDIEKYREFYK